MIQSSKVLPASEVKNSFGTLVGKVFDGTYPEIIIENHGQPIVAIVSVKELDSIKKMRIQQKQQNALAHLRQARQKVQSALKTKRALPNKIDTLSRILITDIKKKGTIRFERDNK